MTRFSKHATAIDLVLTPLAAACLPIVMAIGRMGAKTPISRGLFDLGGMALVRRHYYTPVVMPGSLRQPLGEARDLIGLDLNEEGQLELLAKLRYGEELLGFPQNREGGGYFYNNPNFGPGDAELLYSMIRHLKPKRLLEIGSGYSTLLAKAALDRNRAEGVAAEHICVEPYEQPWLEDVGVELIRRRVEDVGLAHFDDLEANDILFIDSSHVIRPQNDVLHEYLTVLPRLRPGVYVHIHDIFTPHDYPEDWLLHERLLWNEQYLLEAFLSFNSQFEVVMAANWLHRNHLDQLKLAAPFADRDEDVNPGSFWIRRLPQISA